MPERSPKLKCFLSYRRKDWIVAGSIKHIFDRLEKHFGRDHVFMDVDSIPIGADFRQILAEEVEKADVLLAVIGNQWGDFIKARKDDPRDFVRIEIESALAGNIPVVPLLIGDTQMPDPEDLPESLKDLPFKNAFRVDPGRDFERNMARLIRELEQHFAEFAEASLEKERQEKAALARQEAEVAARVKAELAENQRIRDAEAAARKQAEAQARRARKSVKAAGRKKRPLVPIMLGVVFVGVSLGFYVKNSGGNGVRLSHPMPTIFSEGFTNTLEMEFLPVPGLDGVLFSKYETRVQDYAAYAKETPGIDMEWKDYEYRGVKQGPDHPVLNVSWDDAVAFCAWLNGQEKNTGRTYRLATDHEWSVAVGIGDQEDPKASPESKDDKIETYPWGSQWPPPEGAGNLDSDEIAGYTDSFPFTAPVGSFNLDHHGIKDLSGNVYEWVQDWYSNDHSYRVLRGGSWSAVSEFSLSSWYRDFYPSSYRSFYIGFRVVCVVGVVG